ncbi:MAG: bifunctional glutamate N-acetyltransferase/amino-acid acetyltransferase ArgJ [Candidatus Omnitrophica bacterium]|nr:bifunctional glutamate N-acetyltransferase/amino-acid acetyltransferase ArgJ [Candidatus Omnitrophota bacterium]
MGKYILPKGFLASGVHCGIKRFKKDLALIYSKAGCKAVGIFTKNKVRAAPLIVSKSILKKGKPIRAIIINSGNANCCTGWYGVRDAKRMISGVCDNLKLKFNNVQVSSTGIIGKRLPIDLIEEGIPKLVKSLSEKGLKSAASAILTTDKKIKVGIEKFKIGRKEATISGIVKGAGMIHPNMATMLSFIVTDAKIDKDALKVALKEACDRSFNSISIDGDMSTNDTVILLANGLANNMTIKRKTKEYKAFSKALKNVTFKLAKNIVEDGEGATKFVSVYVENAKRTRDAYRVARSVANSCLVKTSIHGENPNWGRVAATVGSSGAEGIKQNKFEIYLDGICVFKGGKFTMPSKEKFYKIYKRKNVEIAVNLNSGKKDARIWTCDLSKRYVEINSHYMT